MPDAMEAPSAAAWRNKMMVKGLFVRDCASFGLPEYIRVGIRSLPDCRRLADAMAEMV